MTTQALTDTAKSAPRPSILGEHGAVTVWLFICAFMVFAMMVIGAITRLTESGLSMVEWRPLIGALPPLSQEEWQRVFELYQATPEYQKKNFWMELDEFKTIFFWEWFHRLWGRTIGLVFALPLLVFWIKGMVPQGYKGKFLFLLLLGGAQGFMGWYMVQSGLIDQPAVSHYRLAAHLGLAFIIFGVLLWHAFTLSSFARYKTDTVFRIHLHSSALFIAITIAWGAFVAGLDAGLLYNDSFPLMGGQIVPPDFWQHETLFGNLLENHSAVQFAHRWLAMFSVLYIISVWAHGMAKGYKANALNLLALMAFLQMGLGIATIFSGVNIAIAAMHQAGAAILVLLLILTIRQTSKAA